jgi:hypothetical protein
MRVSMNRPKSSLLLSLLLICVSGFAQNPGSAASRPLTPIFIELFTSEGCSSCPPADNWLQQIDADQPIPGAQAIVLSEHVDYWDHDGWKDPYSSALFTARQSDYVRALGSSSPYTPELIVDGGTELQLSDQTQVSKAFSKAAKAPQLPMRIGALAIDGNSPQVLRAHIDADGTLATHSADVYAVIALDRAESQVLHGENGGRRLTHAAVAVDLVRVGKLEKGKPFSQDIQMKLKAGLDPNHLRLIVFAQEAGPGNVVAAALQEVRPPAR